mmetsp:Transcript_13694/g.32210  ORF Transcript_13694/g.32210 Transcript_13694/m.32210 type:complete len:153 (+) Transcript_13694:234-692(+)
MPCDSGSSPSNPTTDLADAIVGLANFCNRHPQDFYSTGIAETTTSSQAMHAPTGEWSNIPVACNSAPLTLAPKWHCAGIGRVCWEALRGGNCICLALIIRVARCSQHHRRKRAQRSASAKNPCPALHTLVAPLVAVGAIAQHVSNSTASPVA